VSLEFEGKLKIREKNGGVRKLKIILYGKLILLKTVTVY
jgi:hypothetical protein